VLTSPTGYAAPTTLDEALVLLAVDPDNTIIAGGTDLVPGVRAGRRTPGLLVDLRLLPLDYILAERDGVRLGARVTFTDVLESSVLAAEYPALASAAADVGGPPIRNRATLGGNLVNASPAADAAPPLLVHDASVVLAGRSGRREVPLLDFFQGPGHTVLKPGEILIEIRLPRPLGSTVSSFVKLGTRDAMAIAIVNAAVRVDLDNSGGVSQCRIALGAVAPTPIRAAEAESVIVAQGLTPEAIARAAAEAARAAAPIDDLRATAGYRHRMVEVLVQRLLTGSAAQLTLDNGHG
jgi:CO/xanthine dehydrogenase FAD-binding subunit